MSDRERRRLEKLEELKRENGISVEAARREERTGALAAYREEMRPRSTWRVPSMGEWIKAAIGRKGGCNGES